MRTVSTMRTPATTPKTGTLNSRDIQFQHNTSASSGSHVLDVGRSDEKLNQDQTEAAEVHGLRYGSSDVVTSNHSEHEPRRPPEHHYPDQGATDEFNYSYYQLSYDTSQRSANQNANDNDDNDNLSHDSYDLLDEHGRRSRSRSRERGLGSSTDGELDRSFDAELDRDESFEGELDLDEEEADNLDILETVLHIDEDKFSDDEVEDLTRPDVPAHNGDIHAPEEIHVVKVEEQPPKEDDGSKRVEIEIVEKIETTQVYEKVERTRLIEKIDDEELEQDIPIKDKEASDSNVDSELQQVKVEVLQEKGAQDEAVAEKPQQSSSNEEIPYILHRRHLGGSEKRVSRSKSPAARGYKSMPRITKEQQKTHLSKIKTSLSSPIISPQKSPKSPRDKSPSMTSSFDFVVVNRLPPRDSYSSKDDSLSPSLEKEIIKQMKIKPVVHVHQVSSVDKRSRPAAAASVHPVLGSKMEVASAAPVPVQIPDDQATKVALTLSDLEQADGWLMPPAARAEDLSPTTESDSEHELKNAPEAEEDVNRVLSECGGPDEDSSTASSVSDEEDKKMVAMAASQFTAELQERIRSSSDSISGEMERDATTFIVTENDMPIIELTEDLDSNRRTSFDSFPPPPPQFEGGSSPEVTEGLPIPSIVIKAASDVEPSSSDVSATEEPLPPPPGDDVYQTELYIEESPPRGSEGVDSRPVVRPKVRPLRRHAPVNDSSSSDEEIDLLDSTNLPAPPPATMDISSESDMDQPDLDDIRHMSATLEALATANPYSVPVAADQHFPAPPDISSESDVEQPSGLSYPESEHILKSSVMANPFLVPIAAGTKFPDDISSEDSDSEHPHPHEFDLPSVAEVLALEATANPYSVPIAGDIEFPAPPDISSESDVERPESEDLPDASEILQCEVLANPYSVPVAPGIPAPIVESSEESDSGQRRDEEEEIPDAAKILDADAATDPYMVKGSDSESSENDLPPPPPPPDYNDRPTDPQNLFRGHSTGDSHPPPAPQLAYSMMIPDPYDETSSDSDHHETHADDGDALAALETLPEHPHRRHLSDEFGRRITHSSQDADSESDGSSDGDFGWEAPAAPTPQQGRSHVSPTAASESPWCWWRQWGGEGKLGSFLHESTGSSRCVTTSVQQPICRELWCSYWRITSPTAAVAAAAAATSSAWIRKVIFVALSQYYCT